MYGASRWYAEIASLLQNATTGFKLRIRCGQQLKSLEAINLCLFAFHFMEIPCQRRYLAFTSSRASRQSSRAVD